MDVDYKDPSLTYSGRWTEQHQSRGSAWQGSQIRFSVEGTRTLSVKVRVIDKKRAGPTFAGVNFDGGDLVVVPVSSDEEVLNGERTVRFELPSTAPHDVILKLFAFPDKQWTGEAYVGLKSLGVDSGGRVTSSVRSGADSVEFIGDSWMATQNDWPFLLDRQRYNVVPVSYGGATIAGLDSQYLYSGAQALARDFAPVKAVVIGSAVNDYNNVPLASYKVSMLSLIDKVRSVHPNIPIIVLQAPRNTGAGKDYGRYGPAMAEIAASNEDVTFLSLPATSDELPWRPDNAHLTYEGRKEFARMVEPLLDKILQQTRFGSH